MAKDPLGLFPDEKIELNPENSELDPRRKLPPVASASSLDPGERALAAIAATGGLVTGALLPMAATFAGEHLYSGTGPKWNLAPIQGVRSLEEGIHQAYTGKVNKHKVMGLFDATPRITKPDYKIKGGEMISHDRPTLPDFMKKKEMMESDPQIRKILESEIDKTNKWVAAGSKGKAPHTTHLKYLQRHEAPVNRLMEIQEVVDSFIAKHKLPEKGVRINVQSGPLSGATYDVSNKRVTIPRLSKEVALHELGHAADYTGSRLGRIRAIADPILYKATAIALPTALIAGDRLKEIIPGTVDDKAIAFMQDHAPEIMGATLAATSLFPEAKASFLAVKHIKETQGPKAAKAAFKKLAPFWGTYALSAIPAVVGMALARKYMREAREEKEEVKSQVRGNLAELEKQGSIASGLADIGHVAKQIGHSTKKILTEKGTVRKIMHGAKEVGSSPEFIHGALAASVPAGLGALYMYGTHGGQELRDRLGKERTSLALKHGPGEKMFTAKSDESWKERHPLRFAGLVAAGAALSGGILAKFTDDLVKVL